MSKKLSERGYHNSMIRFPPELLEEVDALKAGASRSQFIREATADRIAKLNARNAAIKAAGIE